MTRQTHGQYDPEKRLPNNAGRAVGSGINVWLNSQVLVLLGEQEGRTLIEQAAPHDEKRYKWTLDELAKRGHDLREEYHAREKQAAADRRLRDKERTLALFQERLAESESELDQRHYKREIEKCKKYIKERKKGNNHEPDENR